MICEPRAELVAAAIERARPALTLLASPNNPTGIAVGQ